MAEGTSGEIAETRVAPGQRSRMAERTAIMRAAHRLLDAEPLVLDDPLALAIIGPEAEQRLRANLAPYRTLPLRRARAINVVRARFTEDRLAQAIERGCRQYVVLGAGLDTFAYRAPYLPGELTVFEVDHPATQAWKHARLAAAGIRPPPNLRFAPVDFNAQTLAAGLADAGFRRDRAAFFSWLGVTYYLPLASVDETLAFIAGQQDAAELVFDFALTEAALPAEHRALFSQMLAFVASQGEPWLTRFEPAALVARLSAAGFEEVQHLDVTEMTRRYLANRRDDIVLNHPVQLIRAATTRG